jgi:hypothetical protein
MLEDDPYNTWSGTIWVVYYITGNCCQTALYHTEKLLWLCYMISVENQLVQVTIQALTVRLSHVITAYMSCMAPKINDTHTLYRTKLETWHSHYYNFSKYARVRALVLNENLKEYLNRAPFNSISNYKMWSHIAGIWGFISTTTNILMTETQVTAATIHNRQVLRIHLNTKFRVTFANT